MKEMYPRWAKAQKYTTDGFKPVDCFAGQVRVHGKKVTTEPFSIFLPDRDKKCCGSLVKRKDRRAWALLGGTDARG